MNFLRMAIFSFTLFAATAPIQAMDVKTAGGYLSVKVILPSNSKTLPAKIKKMINHLNAVVPQQVAAVLGNKLVLNFKNLPDSAKRFNIKCPAELIKEELRSTGADEEINDSQSSYFNTGFENLIFPKKNVTEQYVKVPGLNQNWNNPKKLSLGLFWIHKGFLKNPSAKLRPCYKSGNYTSKTDYLEALILRNIARVWNRNVKLQSGFLASLQRERQFSDSSLFSHLDNWGSSTNANTSKNIWGGDKLKLIAPAMRISALQNFSLEDSFSIYFEKFLNDKNFSCKKPAMHMYFQKIMNFSPFGIKECHNLNTKIYGDFLNKTVFDLNPNRIKEIHILLAGPGRAIMSRWGHTMFRLVVCEKGESGSDCVANSFDDVVLGFRAYVGDMEINPIKGLFGEYPSLVFPAKMSDIKNEYNRTELRDLTSIPINFTQEEKKFFIYKALQDFWTYRGKYYFLTNNCATESNDFLMGSFLSSPKKSYILHEILGDTLTPTGSISDIKAAKKISSYAAVKNTFDLTKMNKKNKKKNRAYVSVSYRPALEKLVKLLMSQASSGNKQLLQENREKDTAQISAMINATKLSKEAASQLKEKSSSLDAFTDLPVKLRAQLYEKLLKHNPRYAISLTLLEKYIKKDLEKSIKSSAVSVAINVKNPSADVKKVLKAFKKVTKSYIQAHSFSSYGVPVIAEVNAFLSRLNKEYKLSESEITVDRSEFEIKKNADWNWKDELVERSEHLAKSIFPEWSKELIQVEQLIKSLREYPQTKTLSF